MTHVLLVTYGGGHANMVIPVIREMHARGIQTTNVALTLAGPRFAAEDLPYLGFRDLLRPGDEDALALGTRLLGDSHNEASGIDEEESRAYLGLSMRDLIADLGEEAAWARYEDARRHAFWPQRTMHRLIDRLQPDAVLATSSPRAERASLYAAREAGIPAIAVDDAFGLRARFLPDFVPDLDADVICVGSTIAIANYAARVPLPSGRLVLTGNPAFDRLTRVPARDETRRRLGIPLDAPLVTIGTQPKFDLERLGEIFSAAAARIPGLIVGIRIHPSMRIREGASPPSWMLDLNDADMDEVLAVSDALATVSSTTGNEALLAGRTLLQFGPDTGVTDTATENVHELPFFTHGASILVERAEDLPADLERALTPHTRDALCERAAAVLPPVGSAAARVTDEVVAAVAGRRR